MEKWVDSYSRAATVIAVQRRKAVTETEFRAALAKAGGSPTRTARALGIHRVTVYKLKRRWRIEVSRTVKVT